MRPRRRARPWKRPAPPAAPCNVACRATLQPALAESPGVKLLAVRFADAGYVVVPPAETPSRAPGAPALAMVRIGGAAPRQGPHDPHRIATAPDDPERIATGARVRVIAGQHADRLGKVVDGVLIGGDTVLVLLDRIGRERAAKTSDEPKENLERVHQLQGIAGDVGDDCIVCGCLDADPYERCPGFLVHVLAREAGEPQHRGACEACGSTNAGAGERCDGRRS